MVETLHKEPVSSDEPVKTIRGENSPNTAGDAGAEKTTESSKQTARDQVAALVEFGRTRGYPLLVECGRFFKRTRRGWMIAAGAVVAVVAMVNLAEHLSEQARASRERRHEQRMASVTPERLIARCGPPTEDTTKEMYPILMRTVSYQPSRSQKLVLTFTRTAEEKSDWVFLAMQDENGATSFNTPETEVAALPCLDSNK